MNIANLRGQDWPGISEDIKSWAAQIDAVREQYLQAVESCKRAELNPVIRSLFEPDLIRLYHRSRASLGEAFTPGANCAPGKRKLYVATNGSYHPCERTGSVMGIGDVESGIKPAAVSQLRGRFHEAVQDRCGNCWALRMCGVCFAVQAEHTNMETGEFPVPESVCDVVRQSKEETLKMMARILQMPEECHAFFDDTVIS